MKAKDELSIERKAYLELWLKFNDLTFKPHTEVIDIIESYFETEERDYLLNAHSMPFDELRSLLKYYDTAKPKLDEIKFISDLRKSYNATTETVIARIRDVRQIDNFFEEKKKTILTYPTRIKNRKTMRKK